MSATRRQTKRDIQKKHQFSLLQPARAVRSPQILHADRERCDNSKWFQSLFDPTHSFSCRGEDAHFWPLTHWVNVIPSGCHGNLPVTSGCRRRVGPIIFWGESIAHQICPDEQTTRFCHMMLWNYCKMKHVPPYHLPNKNVRSRQNTRMSN